MVCYAVPATAAIVHYIMKRNIKGWKEDVHQLWLNLLLIGGAIFGVVDHLWNGELFIIGENVLLDLMLGVTITTIIVLVWEALVVLDRTATDKPSKQKA
ncbi:MAG: hypothetical protein DRO67_02045 [Candidatus Asgardarchaeum californiense]|nr:MAG: hypothetical protein DRO67_02045 [Candidatus Asgardarchaeum californiense]